jgi:hypothetical protein
MSRASDLIQKLASSHVRSGGVFQMEIPAAGSLRGDKNPHLQEIRPFSDSRFFWHVMKRNRCRLAQKPKIRLA